MTSMTEAVRVIAVLAVCAGVFLHAQYVNAPANGGARNGSYVDGVSFRREMTHMSADMRVLQEDIKLLVTRMGAMEAEIQGKDAQIRELQENLARAEQRFQKLEREMAQSEARMRQERNSAIEQAQNANQRALETLQNAMANEISRVDKVAARAANAGSSKSSGKAVLTGSYKEIKVEKGDTLGAIASACGVSVQTLRQVNGLRDNTIRVGQMLKIPVQK